MGPILGALIAILPFTEIGSSKHQIVITIDDHPLGSTEAFLEVLKRCRLKTVFFLVAAPEYYYRMSPAYPPALRQHRRYKLIVEAGHVIGNHGVTHRNLCKIPRSKVRWELETAQRLISKATGVTPKLWRSPFLQTCRVSMREAARLRLRHVSADIDDIGKSARLIWYRVKRRIARHEPRTIVLFHKDVQKFRAFLRLSSICPSA